MNKLIILLFLHTFLAFDQAKARTSCFSQQDFTTFIFLGDERIPSPNNLQKNLQKTWNIVLVATMPNNDEIELTSPKTSFRISLVRNKMPSTEWSSYAGISWLWQNASAEIGNHSAYLKVEIISSDTDIFEQQKMMTKIIATLLEQTASIGVMVESRYLVVSSSYYKEVAKNLLNDELPVYLWVYFGMSADGTTNSGYTYGLQAFGMNELEIVSSTRSMGEVQMVLYESTKTILKNKTYLRDGSKVGDGNQLIVSFSEGVFLKGKTIKIDY